jgi:dipeptidyl-peptidase-4
VFPLYAEDLTLEMIFKYNLFVPDKVEGIRSMNDGESYTYLENLRNIVKFNYATGERTDTLYSLDWNPELPVSEISSYELNDDETMMIFGTDKERIYRYSYQTNYLVYDISERRIIPVFNEGKQQLATISPDGCHVAFVFENNLYLKDIRTGIITQITYDGLKNSIINGSPDWVYEEEFALKTGYYWSPDSRKLAFYRFDESKVREISIIRYNDIYPELYTYKYPKAGEENSIVDIYVYDLFRGTTAKMEIGKDTNQYIPRIKWLPTADRLCIASINRLQNKVDFQICDVTTGASEVFYVEENERYISELSNDFVTFIDSGKQAIVMSEKDGYMHLYRYSLDGVLINQITSGEWEVEQFYGVDESTGKLYYTSTEISPLERHLYSVNLDGTNKEKLTSSAGTHTASFSKTFKYFILTSSDADTPYKITLNNNTGELIRVLEDNSFVQSMMSYFKFTKHEFFSYFDHDNTEIYGYQILPPNFKKNKKYPVLVYVYGGPESQDVRNSWESMNAWFQYLAQHGYIVVCADNRGTNGRGEEFRKSIYMQLGKLEVDDQIALAEYMITKPYVDKNRIGIFGWSYGGYLSLFCMMRGNQLFKTGVAIAPVTDWRYYDSVYTERFMRTPSENEDGYWNGAPINFADMLEGKLLLVHGLDDDNVHFQNSAELISKLVEENKQFDLFVYPDQNHHMHGGNALFHMYNKVTDFIFSNL